MSLRICARCNTPRTLTRYRGNRVTCRNCESAMACERYGANRIARIAYQAEYDARRRARASATTEVHDDTSSAS